MTSLLTTVENNKLKNPMIYFIFNIYIIDKFY